MKKMKCDKTRGKYTLIKVLGIMALALLILVSIAGAAPYAYITNYGNSTPSVNSTVSVIDTATNTLTANVTVGCNPWGVAVNPEGTKVYVANRGNVTVPGKTVSVIDTATNTVIATVNVGGHPSGVAVNPEGTKVYVANQEYYGTVSVIDTATNTVIATVNVGGHPYGVAVTPDGKKVYVANNDYYGTVSVIDTATNTVTATVNVGAYPYGVAVTPAGTKVYVTNNMDGTVSVIDTSTNIVTDTVKVGICPYGVAIIPDGTKVYVANEERTVSVIDISTNSVTATVNGPGGRWGGVSITPDGMKVYVANFLANTVSVIDTATNTVTATVNVKTNPLALGQFIVPSSTKRIFPLANFSSDVTSGYPPLSVQFTDLSEDATGWNWNFGDGTNSTEQNPMHTYLTVGIYKVTLAVSNENGTDAKSSNINVSTSSNVLEAAFTASPSSGKAPLSVNFVDQSIGSPTAWKWLFGDGANSTQQNPVHIYNKTGQYSVTLTASKSGSSSAVTKSSYIAVTNGVEAPDTSFSASPTSGPAPLTVGFTDNSTGSPTSWKWSFGDGSTSTEQNPVHTYNKTGQYSVILTTSNAGGSDALTKTNHIGVTNGVNPPVAVFSASPISGNLPLSVNFTDSSTGSPTSWKWNFGDGTSAIQQNPVHIYNKAGKYTVSLIVSNPGGSSTKTMSRYVTVK